MSDGSPNVIEDPDSLRLAQHISRLLFTQIKESPSFVQWSCINRTYFQIYCTHTFICGAHYLLGSDESHGAFAPVPVELLIFQKHFQLLFSIPSSDCYAAWRETRSIWISFAHLHTVTRRPSPTIVCCKRSQSHFQSASDAPLDCFQVSGWLTGRREWAFNALTQTCQHWPAQIHTCYEPITKLFIGEELEVQNLDPTLFCYWV